MVHTTTSRIGTELPVPKRVDRRDKRRLADREGFLAWALLLPSIVYIVALVGLPLLLAIAFSFSDVTAGDPSFEWDGLSNYRQIFDDPVFWQSLRNTIVFINGNMYWLGRPNLAILSVIVVHAWRLIPLAAVIMMAGLVAIPKDLQEQAEIDSAGYWRRMFEITIPLMMPLIAVAALFGAIVTFTDMTVVYVLTRGGPTNSTQVLPSWAFFRGIEGGDIAQGAAVALFLFPLLLAAAIAILRAVRRMEVL